MIQQLSAAPPRAPGCSVGGEDTVAIGSGYNVVIGGANSDTITVNGTDADAQATVLGDNGLLLGALQLE